MLPACRDLVAGAISTVKWLIAGRDEKATPQATKSWNFGFPTFRSSSHSPLIPFLLISLESPCCPVYPGTMPPPDPLVRPPSLPTPSPPAPHLHLPKLPNCPTPRLCQNPFPTPSADPDRINGLSSGTIQVQIAQRYLGRVREVRRTSTLREWPMRMWHPANGGKCWVLEDGCWGLVS